VADITSVRLMKEFVYASVYIDMLISSIQGRHLGHGLERELTITALGRAFDRGRPEIHHSDHGMQYAATAYDEMLKSVDAQISIASVGEPEENGYAE
jgi:putative transposase